MDRRPARPMRPERFHALVALTLALIGTGLWLWLFRHAWHGYQVLAGWLLAVNLTAFGYYGYDKACARRMARRVPEVVLHGLALVGGSPGAFLAMQLFRHKTIKGRFRAVFWCIIVVQAVLVGWIGWILWRHHAENPSAPHDPQPLTLRSPVGPRRAE